MVSFAFQNKIDYIPSESFSKSSLFFLLSSFFFSATDTVSVMARLNRSVRPSSSQHSVSRIPDAFELYKTALSHRRATKDKQRSACMRVFIPVVISGLMLRIKGLDLCKAAAKPGPRPRPRPQSESNSNRS